VRLSIFRLPSSLHRLLVSHHPNTNAAAVQMDVLRFIILTFIALELFVVFLARFIQLYDSAKGSEKGNGGREFGPSWRWKDLTPFSLYFSSFTVFGMTVAASVVSTKVENQKLYVALVQSASLIFGFAQASLVLPKPSHVYAADPSQAVHTFLLLKQNHARFIFIGVLCMLAELALSFSPLACIDDGKKDSYLNAAALFLGSIIYMVSAWLLWKWISKQTDFRALITLRFILPLAAGGIAFLVLAVISMFCGRVYKDTLLV
jgi:hypothetical protein